MSMMIVGADHLGSIRKNLEDWGVTEVEHVSGRKVADRKRIPIPLATKVVVVLIDYVNHLTARQIKEQAKDKGIPLVFAKRSWCSIQGKLAECGLDCSVLPTGDYGQCRNHWAKNQNPVSYS